MLKSISFSSLKRCIWEREQGEDSNLVQLSMADVANNKGTGWHFENCFLLKWALSTYQSYRKRVGLGHISSFWKQYFISFEMLFLLL